MKIIALNTALPLRVKPALTQQTPRLFGLHADTVSFHKASAPLFAGKKSSAEDEPDAADTVQQMSEQIKVDRSREAYKDLQKLKFSYGGHEVTALMLLEVIYQRDTEFRNKGLTAHYFSQLKPGSTEESNFFTIHQKLIEKKLVEEFLSSEGGAADYVRSNTKQQYVGRVTEEGKAVVQQYQRDQATNTHIEPEEPKEARKAPALEKVTDHNVMKLKTLLGKSDWGQSGLGILKALHEQIEARPWYQKMFGVSVHVSTLKTALNIPQGKGQLPVIQLENYGFIREHRNSNRYSLTEEGKKCVASLAEGKDSALIDNDVIKAEDMQDLLKARIIDIKIARQELEQMLEEFNNAYQKASTEVKETEEALEKLEKEALDLFAQSKDTELKADRREKKDTQAIKKMKEAQKLRKTLVDEKQPALDQAACQWDTVQQINEKVSQNLDAQLQQTQKDQVFLKAAILQNNILEFVSRWALDGTALQNPIGKLRDELNAKWSEQGVATSAEELAVKKRIQKRLELKQDEDIRQQLEQQLQTQASEAPAPQSDTITREVAAASTKKTRKSEQAS